MKFVKPIIEGQPFEKREKITKEYPFLSSLYFIFGPDKNNQKLMAESQMNIVFQVADTNLMHTQANNLPYNRRGSLIGPDGYIGTQKEEFIAIGEDNRILDVLDWQAGEFEKFAKDIFKKVDHNKVNCLAWIVTRRWFSPASEQREAETGCLFGERAKGANINVIIYKKPKDISFTELIQKAEQEKHEQENAYLFPPKEMPELPGIEKALDDGHTFKIFSSGGGLRVVYIENDVVEKGYGEHPHVEEALVHASDDYLVGGRPYKEVYGGIYPHYLTGDTVSTSNIDFWIRKGSKFRFWKENGEVITQLSGYGENEKVPKYISSLVKSKLITVRYKTKRGFVMEVSPCRFANDEIGTSAKVIGDQYEAYIQVDVPDQIVGFINRNLGPVKWLKNGIYYKTSLIIDIPFHFGSFKKGVGTMSYIFKNCDFVFQTQIISKHKKDHWSYKITKTGRGVNFWEATMNAFDAEPVEVYDSE